MTMPHLRQSASTSARCGGISLFPIKKIKEQYRHEEIPCQDLTAEQQGFLEFGREFAEKGGCFTYLQDFC